MTEAENTTIHADKLKNTDISSLEVDSKEIDDESVDLTPAETKALLRKLDMRIVPLICLIYLCSFLGRLGIDDKMHTPNSKIDNIICLILSFIVYLLFEIPSNLILKIRGPSKWIPIVMWIRGQVMHRMATATSPADILISRFILSLTEASLFSGLNFCFSLWYPRNEQASRVYFYTGWCMAGAPIFVDVVTNGMMQFDNLRCLCGQRRIFYFANLLLALLSYYVLPELPKNSNFLTERERAIIHRLRTDTHNDEEPILIWKPFGVSMPDSKLYTHSMNHVCHAIFSYNRIVGLVGLSVIIGVSFVYLNAWPIPLTAPLYALASFHFGQVILHFRKEESVTEHENAV